MGTCEEEVWSSSQADCGSRGGEGTSPAWGSLMQGASSQGDGDSEGMRDDNEHEVRVVFVVDVVMAVVVVVVRPVSLRTGWDCTGSKSSESS